MQIHDIDYRDETVNLRGYLAFDDEAAKRRPGVLVFHEELGLGDGACAHGGAHRGEGDFLRAGQLGHTHMIPPI
jgi:dienelactone hydrolase